MSGGATETGDAAAGSGSDGSMTGAVGRRHPGGRYWPAACGSSGGPPTAATAASSSESPPETDSDSELFAGCRAAARRRSRTLRCASRRARAASRRAAAAARRAWRCRARTASSDSTTCFFRARWRAKMPPLPPATTAVAPQWANSVLGATCASRRDDTRARARCRLGWRIAGGASSPSLSSSSSSWVSSPAAAPAAGDDAGDGARGGGAAASTGGDAERGRRCDGSGIGTNATAGAAATAGITGIGSGAQPARRARTRAMASPVAGADAGRAASSRRTRPCCFARYAWSAGVSVPLARSRAPASSRCRKAFVSRPATVSSWTRTSSAVPARWAWMSRAALMLLPSSSWGCLQWLARAGCACVARRHDACGRVSTNAFEWAWLPVVLSKQRRRRGI